jgi:hypothetical protein
MYQASFKNALAYMVHKIFGFVQKTSQESTSFAKLHWLVFGYCVGTKMFVKGSTMNSNVRTLKFQHEMGLRKDFSNTSTMDSNEWTVYRSVYRLGRTETGKTYIRHSCKVPPIPTHAICLI